MQPERELEANPFAELAIGESVRRTAVGPWSDLALHTIGWRVFQDLCSQVCEVMLQRPVEIFREAQDGGQDAVFLIPADDGAADLKLSRPSHCGERF